VEHEHTYRHTLSYALAIAGTEFALALRLRVTAATLRSWLAGTSVIPDSAFLDAVDLIARATPREIARSRTALKKRHGAARQESPVRHRRHFGAFK